MPHDLFAKKPWQQTAAPPQPAPRVESIENLGSFGWLPAEQARAAMLELRHANGLIVAFSYAWLESAEFNPSEGITLNFSGTAVKLVGRNLNAECRPNVRLFQGILCHRLPWIQETDESAETETDDSSTIVERIEI